MLYASHGIGVPGVSSLTIDGSDSLDATDDKYAAIGGSSSGGGTGTITIKGGTICATVSTSSDDASIGGSADTTSGIIIIYGGDVTASGGNYALGIGGGAEGFDGELTISGVSLKVSDDESTWTNYDGTRKRYMKTN